jgi:hypothetical protein
MLDIKRRHVNQRSITYDIFYRYVKKGVGRGFIIHKLEILSI